MLVHTRHVERYTDCIVIWLNLTCIWGSGFWVRPILASLHLYHCSVVELTFIVALAPHLQQSPPSPSPQLQPPSLHPSSPLLCSPPSQKGLRPLHSTPFSTWDPFFFYAPLKKRQMSISKSWGRPRVTQSFLARVIPLWVICCCLTAPVLCMGETYLQGIPAWQHSTASIHPAVSCVEMSSNTIVRTSSQCCWLKLIFKFSWLAGYIPPFVFSFSLYDHIQL